MDKENAYKLLGVPDDSTKDDISKKYSMLLKKYRLNSHETSDSEQINFNEITKAYNLLMGYGNDDEKIVPDFAGRLKNFIYYHRIHMVLITAIVLLLGYAVKSTFFRPVPDLKVTFMGNIFSLDSEKFRNTIKPLVPELKKIKVTIPLKAQPVIDFSPLGKSHIEITSGELDLCIVDKKVFDKYAALGMFENLDDMVKRLNINEAYTVNCKKQGPDDTEEHAYGIDVYRSKVFSDGSISGIDKIAVIKKGTARLKESVKMLEAVVNNIPDLVISFIGDINTDDIGAVSRKIQDTHTGITNIQVNIYDTIKQDSNESNTSAILRAEAELSAGKLDLCILDYAAFNKYKKTGVLENLSPIIEKLSAEGTYTISPVETRISDGKNYIYGIDVSKSKFFNNPDISGNTKIAVILKATPNFENCEKILASIIKDIGVQ